MAIVALVTISSNSSPLISQIVGEIKYTLMKRYSILANQRQRTRFGIVVGEGDDAVVRRWGGDRRIRCEGHRPPPPSGGKRKTQSPVGGNDNDNATLHDNEPCYDELVNALERGGDPHSSSALSCCPLRLGRLSPQVLPKCFIVLVSCVHFPMPCPRADGLPHNAVCTHIIVESAAVVTPQPSQQDYRQVLHQDHQSVPTLLAPDEYRHGQGRHRAMPPLVY